MWTWATDLADSWASLYANEAWLRTTLGFAHIGGLLAGGGYAIVADRATILAANGEFSQRARQINDLRATHRVVIAGLTLVVMSGLLLGLADVEAYATSWTFWTKMSCIGLLSINGALMVRATHEVADNPTRGWRRLKRAAVASLGLWFLITLLGAALPNA
jgi:hypothetical protein